MKTYVLTAEDVREAAATHGETPDENGGWADGFNGPYWRPGEVVVWEGYGCEVPDDLPIERTPVLYSITSDSTGCSSGIVAIDREGRMYFPRDTAPEGTYNVYAVEE